MELPEENQPGNSGGSQSRYKVVRLLGEGSFGKAFLVLRSDNVESS